MAKQLGVRSVRAEVTYSEDWDRLFEEVLGEASSLDILVNNAGAGGRIAPVIEMSDEDILQSISVNLTGALLGCRRAAKVMRTQRSGTIINISSVCQRQAWPGWSVYSAAKAGLGQFSNGLYTELREYGVRVTTVMPSWGATHFLEAAHLGERDAEEDSQCTQPRDRKLQSDHEEKKDNTKLSKRVSGLGVSDQREAVWTDDHARREKAQYRA